MKNGDSIGQTIDLKYCKYDKLSQFIKLKLLFNLEYDFDVYSINANKIEKCIDSHKYSHAYLVPVGQKFIQPIIVRFTAKGLYTAKLYYNNTVFL